VGPRPFGPDYLNPSEIHPFGHDNTRFESVEHGGKHKAGIGLEGAPVFVETDDTVGHGNRTEHPLGLSEFLNQMHKRLHNDNVLLFNFSEISLAHFLQLAESSGSLIGAAPVQPHHHSAIDMEGLEPGKAQLIDLDSVNLCNLFFENDNCHANSDENGVLGLCDSYKEALIDATHLFSLETVQLTKILTKGSTCES
jgi:hypothetical protein